MTTITWNAWLSEEAEEAWFSEPMEAEIDDDRIATEQPADIIQWICERWFDFEELTRDDAGELHGAKLEVRVTEPVLLAGLYEVKTRLKMHATVRRKEDPT